MPLPLVLCEVGKVTRPPDHDQFRFPRRGREHKVESYLGGLLSLRGFPHMHASQGEQDLVMLAAAHDPERRRLCWPCLFVVRLPDNVYWSYAHISLCSC